MSSTYNIRKLFSSHSVSCKCRSSRYFGQFQNSLIIPSNREFQLRDTSIHMIDKTCLLYRLQPFFNAELEENAVLTIFYQLPVNTQNSSIATHRSQPFEFVKTFFVTNRALCLSLKFHFFLVTLQLLGRLSNIFT